MTFKCGKPNSNSNNSKQKGMGKISIAKKKSQLAVIVEVYLGARSVFVYLCVEIYFFKKMVLCIEE